MTGPVTTEALIEKLARHYREDHAYLRSTAEEMAQALVAGPLAPLLAALQQVPAERDGLRVACLAVQKSIARFPGSVHDRAMAKIDKALGVVPPDFVDPDEIELARLRAEGEAKDRRIARLEAALAPFAKAGELFGPRLSDDYDQSIYAPAAGPEFALSADHLRAARAATAREGQADG